jgi:hypothetical protein
MVTTIGKLLSFLLVAFFVIPFVAGQNGVQGYSGVLHAPDKLHPQYYMLRLLFIEIK